MAPDPEDIIVTTGGQQAIDLVTKTLVDPGDPVICEAPTYPGAVPVFCSYEADTLQVSMDEDGMRIDELEALLDRLAADGRRPKFIYSVPSFQNPAGVTLSAERRRRLVEIARERELLVVEDNPYGLLRYEGEPLPPLYQLDGGDYVIYLGTFSKILSPGIRLGWCVAPPPVMEKIVLGKQATDLCTSTLTQYFVAEYFDEGRWREYVDEPHRALPRATRRDARGARAPLPAAVRVEPARRAASSCGRRCPSYIDTADLLAKALRENVAFVPGAAAYADGRESSSMRLNFSASQPDEIREGIRRIGQVVWEQVALYETITGEHRSSVGRSARAAGGDLEAEGADVLPLRRRDERRGRKLMRVAVLAGGRSLERQVSLRSGARVEDALRSLGHEVTEIDPGADLVRTAQARAPRRRLHRPARARRRGRDGRRSCSRSSASRTPGPASPPACAAWTRSSPSTRSAPPGSRRPTGSAFNATAFRELGAADALEEIEARLGFPLVVKPASQGLLAGRRASPPRATTSPAALVAAFSYDDRVLLERYVEGRELAVGILDGEPLPVVEAIPKQEDFFNFEARYEIGRTTYVCPAEMPDDEAQAGPRRWRGAPTRRSGARASRAST